MKIFFFLMILLFTSCSIKGNFAGLYSYYNKMHEQNPKLYASATAVNSICEIKKNAIPTIYVVNGKEIKECITTKKKSVVYIWGPKCKSKICIPLELIQQKCTLKKIDMYVVAEYYDNNLMDFNYNINNPIFGIDTKYYKSDLTSNYLSKFIFDLTSTKVTENKYLYFEDGKFIDSYNFIDDIH